MKKRNMGIKLGSCFGALGLAVLTGVTPVFARTPNPEVEKTYGVNAFAPEYSGALLYRTNTAVAPGSSTETEAFSYSASPAVEANQCREMADMTTLSTSTVPENYYCGKNTTKSEDYYVKISKGALINNKYYDIKEYIWSSSSSVLWARAKFNTVAGGISRFQSGTGDGEAGKINIEIHFYEAGTNNELKNVKGVTGLADFDGEVVGQTKNGEGITFLSGYKQAYVKSDTDLDYSLVDSKPTWLGTVADQNDYHLWAELDAADSAPIILQYVTYKAGLGMYAATESSMVNYNLVGDVPEGAKKVDSDVYAKNGTATTRGVKAIEGYDFDGWYTDEKMTTKAPATFAVSEDANLYGKYTKNSEIAAPDTGSMTGEVNANVITISVAGLSLAALVIGLLPKLHHKKVGFKK